MPYLVVSPLSALQDTIERHKPQAMISLLGPDNSMICPKTIGKKHHLALTFNDISSEQNGLIAPNSQHVEAILAFTRQWDQAAPLLVHCLMGISRSTAAAFIMNCALNPSLNEAALAKKLRIIAPSATPNSRMIALADDILQRNGRMIEAICLIGRGREAREGTPFILDDIRFSS